VPVRYSICLMADPSSSSSSDAPLPGARSALALLLSINLLNYIDRYVLASLESPIQTALFPGKPLEDAHVLSLMGSLGTAFIVVYMIAAPIFGWLADRFSRWLLCGIGVLVWSFATGGSGLAPTFAAMLLMRMCVGIGEAGYGPAAPTLISDMYPIRRRGSVLAWFYLAIPVGSAIGYGLGGVLGSHFGWRTAFFAVTPPGILLGIICFFMPDPPRGQTGTQLVSMPGTTGTQLDSKLAASPLMGGRKLAASRFAGGGAGWGEYRKLLSIPSYLLDSLGMTALTFAIGGISYWMPHYVHDVRHAGSLAHCSLMFGGITVLAGITATLSGGWAGDALRKHWAGSYFIVSGVGLLLSCPFILLILYTPFPYAWIFVFLAEFWLFFNTGPSNTILANVTNPRVRSTAFALNIFLIHALGDAPAPPLLGRIAGNFGWNAAFMLITVFTALGGVIWLCGAKYLAADTECAAMHNS